MADYLASIRADTAGLAAVVRSHSLDLPVRSCPGWDLRDLAEHVGHVQRWARLAAATAAPPEDGSIAGAPAATGADTDAAILAEWLLAGADALVAELAAVPPDAPTWHPFPVPQVAAVWPRRQAHEIAIHRWDGEAAVGEPAALDPVLAADFVLEYFEVIVPRVIERDGRSAPTGSTRVVLSDVEDAFVVTSTATTVEISRSGPLLEQARIEGTSEDVLLALWRRHPLAAGPIAGVGGEWLAFGGN